MSKKSRRAHLARSKRKKSKSGSLATAAQQQPVTQAPGSTTAAHRQPLAQAPAVSHPGASTSSVREPAPGATSAVAQHPYISAEMRRIGILAGIIISVLVVLAVVLS